MKKLILFVIFFIAIFYFTDLKIFKDENVENGKEEYGNWDDRAYIGECELELEVVNDDVSRQAGLSNRDSLCEKCGMLFEFPNKDRQVFWMKDMQFNLDIIWIEDNKVVAIEKNVPYDFEGTLPSLGLTNKVLEVNAGKSDECKIKKGSILNYVD